MINLKEKIEALSEKAKVSHNGADAMHFAQAALNLAHAYSVLKNADKGE